MSPLTLHVSVSCTHLVDLIIIIIIIISMSGSVVKGEFVKSGLTAQTLSEIWSLSDISKTGSLSADEFCLAMYLVRLEIGTPDYIIVKYCYIFN